MLFLPVEVALTKNQKALMSHVDQKSAAGHPYLMYTIKDSPDINFTLFT